MGLDAFVYCRCWQDGLTTPCPVEPVGIDEEGYLALLRPWEGNKAAHRTFDAWKAEACPHKAMEQASEHVSNWAGVRLFQQALRAAGEHRFPALAAALPDVNGGFLPADRAAVALAELDAFADVVRVTDEVELIDEATGAVVMQYVEAYRGLFMFGPGFQAGVDPDGFFVLDRADPPVTLFRAVRFGQRPLPGDRVEFTPGGTRTVVAMRSVGEHGEPPPERLAVRTRSRSGDDFAYIVEPLRRLCAASVATGNPVMWY
ncbi:hypothetical protein [Micromonospora sp. C28ISP2-4]|uniref:hypothetical protein n=1 Tax=Micromonospora sp. C28ISP2-4 TaxID=3059523 RepID=UPI002675AD12|nr:hypothetical protein [Micromonospora sp. C28ISP2-4]MDO3687244.1 hypothetical protein [Micromonospora sp. C28ISP2-4]